MAAPRRRAHRAAARPQPAKPRAAPPSPLPALDPRLVEGIALFNQRQFYSSHDTLEQLWLQTEGRPREFYQGLIQAAVACYHWSKGNLPGALSLYQSSRDHLARYRPAFLGVDVDGFLARYTELFDGSSVVVPRVGPGQSPVWHQYTVQVDRRDELQAFLKERGVGSMIYYPVPLHRQRCFAKLVPAGLHLPITDRICGRVLSLPCHPMLDDADVNYVAACVGVFR